MRRLSGYIAIAARMPILMAMAVSGLFTLVIPRRKDRLAKGRPRLAPLMMMEERSDWEHTSKRAAANAKSGFLASCRRAEPQDYQEWLAVSRSESSRSAGTLNTLDTHTDRCYGYPQWVVAERDITVTPLHGAMAVNIIVPIGVKLDGNLGHSRAYLMDGTRLNDYAAATRYRNT